LARDAVVVVCATFKGDLRWAAPSIPPLDPLAALDFFRRRLGKLTQPISTVPARAYLETITTDAESFVSLSFNASATMEQDLALASASSASS